jgi:YVTN family beta-propeller protein
MVLTPAGSFALHRASTEPPKPITLVGNSVAAIDPETNAIVGEIPVEGIPGGIAVGAGSVWVGNQVDNTLLRIDPESRQVQKTIELGAQPLDVAVNAGAVQGQARRQIESFWRLSGVRQRTVGLVLWP